MTDRLGLLRSILANPADDLPRLVYADWLEENGTTDADAARAELIRLWFRPKGGPRTATKIFAAWLKTNCWRLWPATAAAADKTQSWVRAQGRCLNFGVSSSGGTFQSYTWIKAYYDRGFATEVIFERDRGYQHFWRAAAFDEPLAVFGPQGIHCRGQWPDLEGVVESEFWGQQVYDRVSGFDLIRDGTTKVFSARTSAVNNDPDRDRNAIRAAMTALAREANGLTPPPTESA